MKHIKSSKLSHLKDWNQIMFVVFLHKNLVKSDVSDVVFHPQLEGPGVPQNPASTSISTGQSRGRHPHLPRDRLPSCQRLRDLAAAPTAPPQRGGAHPCQAAARRTEALWMTTSEGSGRDRGESGRQTTSAAPHVEASRSTCPALTTP